MTSKIDVRSIFSDHVNTFRDARTDKYSLLDFAVMIAAPVAVAVLAYEFGFKVKETNIGVLVSIFSIFAGLLFNVLILIYSFSNGKEDGESDERHRLKITFLGQCFSNISYAVVIALITVALLAVIAFVDGEIANILSAIFIFLGFNFALTLLMVLKRIHVLFKDKF